jgi:hypothetical protein
MKNDRGVSVFVQGFEQHDLQTYRFAIVGKRGWRSLNGHCCKCPTVAILFWDARRVTSIRDRFVDRRGIAATAAATRRQYK